MFCVLCVCVCVRVRAYLCLRACVCVLCMCARAWVPACLCVHILDLTFTKFKHPLYSISRGFIFPRSFLKIYTTLLA